MTYLPRLSKLARFGRDIRANVAVIAAFSALPMMVGAGVAVDFARANMYLSELQSAADAAALAGSSNIDLSGPQRQAKASAIFAKNFDYPEFEASATVTINGGITTVNAVAVVPTTLTGLMNFDDMEIGAMAEAAANRGRPACVLALDPAAEKAIYLDSNAQINATDCKVHANSNHSRAIWTDSNSHLLAEQTTTVGGTVSYASSTIEPAAHTGAGALADPMAGVAAPPVGACIPGGRKSYDSVPLTINPGVYCGGLELKGNANITFAPGLYVIKDGNFFVDSNSRATGTGVTFYLTGAGSTLHFTSNTVISFTASATTAGNAIPGVLFFEDRANPLLQQHRLDSNSISKLEGAVYLSRGLLSSDSNSQIAADSAFTVIVARRIQLNSNARFVLNANYEGTTVPVIGGGTADVRLTH